MPRAPSEPLTTLLHGYARRLLRVDLTNSYFTVESIPEETLRLYLGAKGLGARLLIDNFPTGAEPLGRDNPLIIATGPYQGSMVSSAGRAVILTRSPLTGIFLDSYFGGDFGHVLKRAGFDAVLFTGAAARPATVHVGLHGAEFASAEGLWGKTTGDTERALRKQRPKAQVLSIGPAGEKRVRFASPITHLRRAAGRGGSGAVMGAKKLKAVTVQGEAAFVPADPEGFKKLNRQVNATMRRERKEGEPFYTYGTTRSPTYASATDRLPTRNYQAAQFEGADKLGGEALHQRFDIAGKPCCAPCLMACEGQVKGRKRGEKGAERPEYETLALLGSNLGLDDPALVMEYNDLCNSLGLDTISTGGVIGFALESTRRGLLELPYEFGDPAAASELIPLIAAREGVGDLLAEGVRAAAERLGGEAYQWAVHVKGLELPAWDPRGKLSNGMAYATADIGGSHMREWTPTTRIPDEPALPLMPALVQSQNEKVLRDCYILCTFALDPVTDRGGRELFNAITGFGLTGEGFDTAAERVWSLIRAFNNTLGVDRSADTLCHRLLNDPLPTGPAAGCTAFVSEADREACLDRYYELRGWDENGRVPPERLRKLGVGALMSP